MIHHETSQRRLSATSHTTGEEGRLSRPAAPVGLRFHLDPTRCRQAFEEFNHEETVYFIIMSKEAIFSLLTVVSKLESHLKLVLESPKQVVAEEPRLYLQR